MDYQKTVRILIGTKEEDFTVPQRLLIDKSDFFKSACTKPWKEAEERTIRLPEMTVEHFGNYLHWIFKGAVPTHEQGSANNEEYSDALLSCYIDLYITADQLGDI